MIQNKKKKGTKIEHKVIKMLEQIGFRCIRSAGSHGPFDIVAFLQPVTFLLQIKANRKPSPEEIEEMRSWKVGPTVIKAYVIWKDGESWPEWWWEWDWRS